MENRRFRISLWLVNTLLNYRKLTLEELSTLWRRNLDLSEGEPLSRSQMRHAISAALDSLGVVIECDRRDGFRYYIAANDNLRATEWLISSHAVNQVLTESDQVRERILLEEIPSGQHHLSTIIDAMTNGLAMEMDYQKFTDSEPYTCFIEPYCVKLSQQRWYLLACKDHRDHLQVFSLDRIQQLRILPDQPFKLPAGFSAHDYFANSLGVFAGNDQAVAQIRIRANRFMTNYLRTLPLHPSQKEVSHANESTIFEYTLAPTPDLLNTLLSYGPNVEVLEPLSFRQQMQEATSRMSDLYKK